MKAVTREGGGHSFKSGLTASVQVVLMIYTEC